MPHKMNLQPSKRILRQFSAACLFVGGLSCWRLWSEGPTIVRYGVIAVAFAVGSVGLVAPRLVRSVYAGASLIVFPIGWVVSHALLGLVYYALITPLGWTMRMMHRDRLRIRRPRDATTYWSDRTMSDDSSRYLQPF